MVTKLKNHWLQRWLNPKTIVKKSPICASGVFAKEKINKGEIIRVTGGIIVPKSEARKYHKSINYEVNDIPLDVSDEFLLAPTQEELELTATINHSCDPNAGFLDTITIIAIRDINPGEEIAWDYAFSQTNFKSFVCKCKSANCRKKITPEDWKIKEIQKKWGGYFSPYLKARISKFSD